MLSNKVIDYLNKQGVYSEKEDKASLLSRKSGQVGL